MLLTVIAVTTKKHVETYEIRATTESSTLRDENILDESEAADHDTWGAPEHDAVDRSISPGQSRKRLERAAVVAQEMQATQKRERPRSWDAAASRCLPGEIEGQKN